MSLQVNVDGRPDDRKLSEQELEVAKKDERDTAIVDDHIKSFDSGYQTMGDITPQRMPDGSLAMTVTKEHLQWGPKDVRTNRAQGRKVIPVGHIVDPKTGETHWLLNDADGQAMTDGYICENCLEYQESHLTIECKSVHGTSCGHKRWRQ